MKLNWNKVRNISFFSLLEKVKGLGKLGMLGVSVVVFLIAAVVFLSVYSIYKRHTGAMVGLNWWNAGEHHYNYAKSNGKNRNVSANIRNKNRKVGKRNVYKNGQKRANDKQGINKQEVQQRVQQVNQTQQAGQGIVGQKIVMKVSSIQNGVGSTNTVNSINANAVSDVSNGIERKTIDNSVSGKELNPETLMNEITRLNREISLLKEKNQLLKEMIKFYQNKKKLKDIQEELQPPQSQISEIQIEKPSEMEVLKQQIEELREELNKVRNERKKQNLPLIKKTVVNVPTANYRLIAILNDKALLKDDRGNKIWIKDGQKLNGEKVRIKGLSVFIGNKELSILDTEGVQREKGLLSALGVGSGHSLPVLAPSMK